MLAIVVLLVLPSIGHSQVDSSFFSGFEVFPGVRRNKATIGASFAGWSNDAQQPGTSTMTNADEPRRSPTAKNGGAPLPVEFEYGGGSHLIYAASSFRSSFAGCSRSARLSSGRWR
jgi:hypothetical protein